MIVSHGPGRYRGSPFSSAEGPRVDARVFDFEGKYGEDYEALAHAIIPGYATLFPMVAALLDPSLPQAGKVVVVGAGTGVELSTLKSHRPDLALTGVDPSGQMLEFARARLEQEGNSSDVTLFEGYLHETPDTPRFHGGTLINVLHFQPDDGSKDSLLSDLGERILPGGMLVVFDLFGDPTSRDFTEHLNAWRRLWAIRGMNAEARKTFNKRLEDGMHYVPGGRIVEIARNAGFDEPRQFYRSLLYGGWTFRRRA